VTMGSDGWYLGSKLEDVGDPNFWTGSFPGAHEDGGHTGISPFPSKKPPPPPNYDIIIKQ